MNKEVVRDAQDSPAIYLKATVEAASALLQLPRFEGVSLARLLALLPLTLRRLVPPPTSPEETLRSRATAIALLRYVLLPVEVIE